MRFLICVLIVIFSTVACGYSFENVQYVRNYDGDTITFNIDNVHPLIGKEIRVRLNDIDTYEIVSKDPKAKKLALEAKVYVETIMKRAKRIDLLNVKRGSFFRLIADVSVDGKDLVTMIKKKGFDEVKTKETFDFDKD